MWEQKLRVLHSASLPQAGTDYKYLARYGFVALKPMDSEPQALKPQKP